MRLNSKKKEGCGNAQLGERIENHYRFHFDCFNSSCLIVMPVAAPILAGLGVDLIWFAVLFVINVGIAMLTPPVGFNLYVIQQISGTPLERVIRGSIPFMITLLVGMAIVGLVPQLATWLPSTMK